MVADLKRCPACGASLAADAAWCSQCFARFDEPARPEPDLDTSTGDARDGEVTADSSPIPVTTSAGPTGVRALADLLADQTHPAGAAATAGPTWPCQACGHANPLTEAACQECGSAFLTPSGEAPQGWLARVTEVDRGQRMLLAVGAAITIVCVLLAVASLIGLLL